MTPDETTRVEKPKLAYNLEEAAEATGYSTSTLRIAIRRHDLLARYANTKAGIYTKVGKRIMLHEDDIKRLVAWIREEQSKAGEWREGPDHDPVE